MARRNGFSSLFAVAVAISLGALLALPALAGASTTVGQTFVPTVGTTCNGSPDWEVLQTARASGPSYAAPSKGVLTSWSFEAGTIATTLTMRAFHPTGTAHQYKIVGDAGALQTIASSSGVHTFPARIPVEAGDFVGIRSTTGECASSTGNSGDKYDFHIGTITPVANTVTLTEGTGYIWDISAQLEADADNDGFGDETQDKCSTDATAQGNCPADLTMTKTADAGTVNVGGNVTYTLTVKNNSTQNPAQGVSVNDVLPPNVALVSAAPTQGTCSGAVACALGDIPAGGTAKITVVVRATGVGPATDTATASSLGPDPNAGDNSATVTTNVIPANAPLPALTALTLQGGTFTVGNDRKVKVPVTCPTTAVSNCVGTDTLKTAGKVLVKVQAAAKKKKRVLTLGKASFSIPPGSTAKVTIKLSKKAFKLLKAKGKLKAIETVVAHDSRNVNKTSAKKITLKAPKPKKKK